MTIKGYYFLTPCRLIEAPFVTRTIMETFFNIASARAELRILPIIWYSSEKSNAGILQILMCLVLL